jgi:hypothetical protein
MTRAVIKFSLSAMISVCFAVSSVAQSNALMLVAYVEPRPASPLKAPDATAFPDMAQGWMFAPPAFSWQTLPYKSGTETFPAAKTGPSTVALTQARYNAEEHQMSLIQRISQNGGLKAGPSLSDRRLDAAMRSMQAISTEASFNEGQINMFNTFLH